MWSNKGIILWIFMFMRVFNSIANSAEQLYRHVESDVFWRNTEPVSIQFKDGLSLCNNSSNKFSSEEYRCGPCGESLDIHHSLEDILYFPVVQNVSVGDTINISIKSVHGGQLYFRLCEIFEMDKCFTRQKLYILESEDYVYTVTYEDVDINLTIQLPDNVTGSRYVLQWNFVSDDTYLINCADIAVINKQNDNEVVIADLNVSSNITHADGRINIEINHVSDLQHTGAADEFRLLKTNISNGELNSGNNSLQNKFATTVEIGTKKFNKIGREFNTTDKKSNLQLEFGEQTSKNSVFGTILDVIMDYFTGGTSVNNIATTKQDTNESNTIQSSKNSQLVPKDQRSTVKKTFKDHNSIEPLLLTRELSIDKKTYKKAVKRDEMDTLTDDSSVNIDIQNDTQTIQQSSNVTNFGTPDIGKELGREDIGKYISTPDTEKELGTHDIRKDIGVQSSNYKISTYLQQKTNSVKEETLSIDEQSLNSDALTPIASNSTLRDILSNNSKNDTIGILDNNTQATISSIEALTGNSTQGILQNRDDSNNNSQEQNTQIKHIEKMYDHTVTDETSVKGKQSHVPDGHSTEETVDNQPRVILNKLNRTDMDDTVINIADQQNTEFDAWFASFKDASLDNLQPDSNNMSSEVEIKEKLAHEITDKTELAKINLYGLLVPASTEVSINSIYEKRDKNGMKSNIQNYVNAQFSQMKELSPVKHVSVSDKSFTMSSKDLMELYLQSNSIVPKHVSNSFSKEAVKKVPLTPIRTFKSDDKGSSLSWLSGKTTSFDSLKNYGSRSSENTMLTSKSQPLTKQILGNQDGYLRLSPATHGYLRLSRPTLSFINNAHNVKVTKIRKRKKKRKRKRKIRKSKSKKQLQSENNKKTTKSINTNPSNLSIKFQKNNNKKPTNEEKQILKKNVLPIEVKYSEKNETIQSEGKYRIDVKNVLQKLKEKKDNTHMSKYGDLPERGKINMAVNVFGINIQSADTRLPQQEATYKTMTNTDHTLKIEPTDKKTKQSMMNKTKKVPLGRSKLHPDYIIHGSVKINESKQDPFKDGTGKTSTHHFASTVISDLIDRGFIEKDYPAITSGSNPDNFPFGSVDIEIHTKPKGRFIDNEYSATDIESEGRIPLQDNGYGSSHSVNNKSGLGLSNTQDHGHSKSKGKSSVIADLMEMGFLDKDTLPLIDLTKSEPKYVILGESHATADPPNVQTPSIKLSKQDINIEEENGIISTGEKRKNKNIINFHPTENTVKVITKKSQNSDKSMIRTNVGLERQKEILSQSDVKTKKMKVGSKPNQRKSTMIDKFHKTPPISNGDQRSKLGAKEDHENVITKYDVVENKEQQLPDAELKEGQVPSDSKKSSLKLITSYMVNNNTKTDKSSRQQDLKTNTDSPNLPKLKASKKKTSKVNSKTDENLSRKKTEDAQTTHMLPVTTGSKSDRTSTEKSSITSESKPDSKQSLSSTKKLISSDDKESKSDSKKAPPAVKMSISSDTKGSEREDKKLLPSKKTPISNNNTESKPNDVMSLPAKKTLISSDTTGPKLENKMLLPSEKTPIPNDNTESTPNDVKSLPTKKNLISYEATVTKPASEMALPLNKKVILSDATESNPESAESIPAKKTSISSATIGSKLNNKKLLLSKKTTIPNDKTELKSNRVNSLPTITSDTIVSKSMNETSLPSQKKLILSDTTESNPDSEKSIQAKKTSITSETAGSNLVDKKTASSDNTGSKSDNKKLLPSKKNSIINDHTESKPNDVKSFPAKKTSISSDSTGSKSVNKKSSSESIESKQDSKTSLPPQKTSVSSDTKVSKPNNEKSLPPQKTSVLSESTGLKPNNEKSLPSKETSVSSDITVSKPDNEKSLPSRETSVSSDSTVFKPDNEKSLPSKQTSVLSDTTVSKPDNEKSLPSKETSVSSDNTVSKSDNEKSLPSKETSMSSDTTVSKPDNEKSLPSKETSVSSDTTVSKPDNEKSLPSKETSVSFDNTVSKPDNEKSLPSKETSVSSDTTVSKPDNEKSIPSKQASVSSDTTESKPDNEKSLPSKEASVSSNTTVSKPDNEKSLPSKETSVSSDATVSKPDNEKSLSSKRTSVSSESRGSNLDNKKSLTPQKTISSYSTGSKPDNEKLLPSKETSVSFDTTVSKPDNEKSLPSKQASVLSDTTVSKPDNAKSLPSKEASVSFDTTVSKLDNEKSLPLKETSVSSDTTVSKPDNENSLLAKETSVSSDTTVSKPDHVKSLPSKGTSVSSESRGSNLDNKKSLTPQKTISSYSTGSKPDIEKPLPSKEASVSSDTTESKPDNEKSLPSREASVSSNTTVSKPDNEKSLPSKETSVSSDTTVSKPDNEKSLPSKETALSSDTTVSKSDNEKSLPSKETSVSSDTTVSKPDNEKSLPSKQASVLSDTTVSKPDNEKSLPSKEASVSSNTTVSKPDNEKSLLSKETSVSSESRGSNLDNKESLTPQKTISYDSTGSTPDNEKSLSPKKTSISSVTKTKVQTKDSKSLPVSRYDVTTQQMITTRPRSTSDHNVILNPEYTLDKTNLKSDSRISETEIINTLISPESKATFTFFDITSGTSKPEIDVQLLFSKSDHWEPVVGKLSVAKVKFDFDKPPTSENIKIAWKSSSVKPTINLKRKHIVQSTTGNENEPFAESNDTVLVSSMSQTNRLPMPITSSGASHIVISEIGQTANKLTNKHDVSQITTVQRNDTGIETTPMTETQTTMSVVLNGTESKFIDIKTLSDPQRKTQGDLSLHSNLTHKTQLTKLDSPMNYTAPGYAKTLSKVDKLPPKAVNNLPTANKTLLKTVGNLPKADIIIPKADNTLLESDKSIPKADKTLPNASKTQPNAGKTLSNTDNTLPKSDKALAKSDKTLPKSDKALAKSDKTLPKSDKALPKADTTLPNADKTLPMANKTLSTAVKVETIVSRFSSNTTSESTQHFGNRNVANSKVKEADGTAFGSESLFPVKQAVPQQPSQPRGDSIHELHMSSTGVPRLTVDQSQLPYPPVSSGKTPLVSPTDLIEIFRHMDNTTQSGNVSSAQSRYVPSTHSRGVPFTQPRNVSSTQSRLTQYRPKKITEAFITLYEHRMKPSIPRIINSVSYAAVLRSLNAKNGKIRKETVSDANERTSQQPSAVTTTPIVMSDVQKNAGIAVPINYQTTTQQEETISNRNEAINNTQVGLNNQDQKEKQWPSLASGAVKHDTETPGMVIDNQDNVVITGQYWPALVSQNLHWADTAPHSMSLSIGHNTDGTYISDPLSSSLGSQRSPPTTSGKIDKVYSTLHRIHTKHEVTREHVNNNNLTGESIFGQSEPITNVNTIQGQRPVSGKDMIATNNNNKAVTRSSNTITMSTISPKAIAYKKNGINNERNQQQWYGGRKYVWSNVMSFSGADISNKNTRRHSAGSGAIFKNTRRHSAGSGTIFKPHEQFKMHPTEPDFKTTAETLSPNIQLLSSVLKVKAPNVRPSPHVYRAVNKVQTQLNQDNPYFNGQMSDIQARPDNQHFQRSDVKIPSTPTTKLINRRFDNAHGVDTAKHPGIQLMNMNHVDSTKQSEVQLINKISPYPVINPDFWNRWSLSKTTENIKTHDMPMTPPPNHQVKGERINHIKELDLRSKLPGIQLHGLHIKTANNVKNGAIGVKTIDVTTNLQQHSEPRHQQQPPSVENKKVQNEASAFKNLPNIGTLYIASSGMQLKSNVPVIKLPVGGIRPGHTTIPISYGNNIASLPLTRSQGQPIIEYLPRTSSQRASNTQSVQSASGQGPSNIEYVPLSRSQGQPSVPKHIQIQGIMPASNGLQIYSTNKGTHNTQTQNVKSQNQKVQLPIPPNVVPQIEQLALPFITRKNSIRIGSGISTTGQNSFQKLSNGQGTAQTNSKYHLAQSPTHTPSILPFGVKLRQFQHQVNSEVGGTRRSRVQSLNKQSVVKKRHTSKKIKFRPWTGTGNVEQIGKMHNHVHIPIHNHGHINSKIRPPIDVTGSRKTFPSKGGIAISVDIRSIKNISIVCSSAELFTCNPKGNHALISGSQSRCVSQCQQGFCPISECECFCVSTTTHDIRNIIIEQPSKLPDKRLHKQHPITTFPQNSNSKWKKRSKNTINFIGMNTNMGSPRNTLNYTVTCSATKLFAAIQGMNTWCQSKCNLKQTDCPKHMCSCKPIYI